MNLNSSLSFYNIYLNPKTKTFWDKIKQSASAGGQFIVELALLEQNRYMSRNNAEWSLPWPVTLLEEFKMPSYDPNFNKEWRDITDARALEIAKLIDDKNLQFAAMYSGGIDSTHVLSALIKNLNDRQLKNIFVYCNMSSLQENPLFFKNFVSKKFKLINSSTNTIEQLLQKNIIPISSLSADCLHGSINWTDLWANFYFYIKDLSQSSKKNLINLWPKAIDGDTHFSNFKDLIISFYSHSNAPGLGESYYNKMVKNINQSDVPVQSLYDFFWWNLFNIKFVCLLGKSAALYNHSLTFQDIHKSFFDWYNTNDYQRWSMKNNNNGKKIKWLPYTLKNSAKQYIYELDKNEWYYHFKHKVTLVEHEKIKKLSARYSNDPDTLFCVTQQGERMYLDNKQTQEYIEYHITRFQKDW